MLPALVDISGAPWKVLPQGVHQATLSEVENFFSTNHQRRELCNGLMEAAKALSKANVQYLYLDGSFVTGKPIPGDYDACWDPTTVDITLLDPVFLDFSKMRANQKAKYKGEFFPFNLDAGNGKVFLDFFQEERHTGKQKGIIKIDLSKESFK
jgi:hypothetical protein